MKKRFAGKQGIMLRLAAAVLVFVLSWTSYGAAPSTTAPAPLSAEQLELTTLAGQLKDPSRSPKTKLEAASLLLARDSPPAVEILRELLAAQDNPGAQIAVAEAIAASATERREFVEPLLAVLRSGEPSVRASAARALVKYRNFGVVEKLIALAKDTSAEGSIRAEVIAALTSAPDKRTVEAMVGLLEDPAPMVQAAAAESLARLTDIRAFGDDPKQWKQWWQANKDKDWSTWLADLADSLARAKAALEADNARLRERLAQTLSDLYDVAPDAQREAMLMGFLKDALPDVRLAGLRLVDRRIASSEPVSPDMRSEVRSMLADGEGRIRQEAAILVASLADEEALKALLDRLAVEGSPKVREALLKALGQLRQAEALPAVLEEIGSRYENVSAAATAALARIASKVPLDEAQRKQAVEAIILRYKAIDPLVADGTGLREALLSAMGAVEDESFMPVLQEALKDPSAKVRLAATTSLAKVGKSAAAAALAALTADSDRGVRQAAIAALGTVGGKEHLPTVLNLTNPAVESDAVVRQQAWDVVLSMLAGADDDTVFSVADNLAARDDASAERIKVLQMLVDRLGSPPRSTAAGGPLKTYEGRRLALAQRRLAAVLMQANRPAEAAAQLGEAYAAYASRRSAEAPVVWEEWLDALLAADDPACATAMASQTDAKAFAAAFRKLMGRLSELRSQEKHLTVTLLAGAALEHLSSHVSDSQRETLRQMAEEAKAKQSALDEQKVATLVPLLVGDEESARKAASELVAMSTRATQPLLAELRKAVTGESANPEIEKAVVEVLRQISPKLSGYDTSASTKAKLELIDAWAAQ